MTGELQHIPPPPLWTRLLYRQVQLLMDIVILLGSFVVAYLLRFDFDIPDDELARMLVQLPLVLLLQFAALALAGIYSFVWRYVGLREVPSFLKAAVGSAAVLLFLRFGLPDGLHLWRVPLSVILIDAALAFGGALSVRVMRRVLYESYERERLDRTASRTLGGRRCRKPVLLVGAGRGGVLAVREIQARGDFDIEVMGFVDDDPLKQGTVIHGVRVLGTIRDLPRLVRELGIDHVVITIAETRRQLLRRIAETCQKSGVRMRSIPGFYEILQGKVEISRMRDVAVETLLGREPVYLDQSELDRFLGGRRVLVTGAGGSIGSELARQVARFRPSLLLLLDRAEGALFEVDRELRQLRPELDIRPLIADVVDAPRIRALLTQFRPEVVLHAAAHKHVPMMESNASEAIKNNVFGTRILGELSGELGVEAFVLISTDKAVHPSSIMGASKRIAELVIQDLDQRYRTRYVAVRFGNVMGSAGSVIPIFREQISRGGPVTVTHPDMMRYFMTIPEAAQLVLETGAMGDRGEIYILDMGEPVRILDLARDLITLSGFRPYEDVDIVFTGLRPGEKLFEELEVSGENIAKTRHPKIFIGRLPVFASERLSEGLKRLAALGRHGHDGEIREFLAEFLDEANLMTGRAGAAILHFPGRSIGRGRS
ncbi:MAG TPA: nucleoside-diphosphate sugar epimerase/dehydratase [Thermoanaerobaculia bacterium]|nr:nucleoside-diphosphate sugar epimerase/dehydratase [Thermoanaerobaculia bacterium]